MATQAKYYKPICKCSVRNNDYCVSNFFNYTLSTPDFTVWQVCLAVSPWW